MDNRSLATINPPDKKGRMVAGYPAPPARHSIHRSSTRSVIDLPWNHRSIYRGTGDRNRVESLIDSPWNQ